MRTLCPECFELVLEDGYCPTCRSGERALLVTGDRNWGYFGRVKTTIEILKPSIVVQGGAKGADTAARIMAQELKIPNIEFQAEWDKYHKAAGPHRNKKMLEHCLRLKKEEFYALDFAIFHDNLGASKGTRNMAKQVLDVFDKFDRVVLVKSTASGTQQLSRHTLTQLLGLA